MFGKWFEETAFSSEDAFEWTVSTAERQLTYPEDSPQDNNTYVVDSSAEDDIDTELSRGRAQFRYRGLWWRGQF